MTSLPFHSDDAIGAHHCAKRAADALLGRCRECGRVALLVELILGDGKTPLGAGIDTKTAALAHIRVKCDFTHFGSSLL